MERTLRILQIGRHGTAFPLQSVFNRILLRDGEAARDQLKNRSRGKSMSIHLYGESGDTLRASNGQWCFYLELAHYHFGWNPEGTKKPKGYGLFKSWEGGFEQGGYTSSDGQVVSSSDASMLAAALARALSDPLVGEKGSMVADSMNEEVRSEFGGTIPPEIQPMLISGEIDRDHVNELIDLCKRGAFRIE